jgi:DNA-binding beta-propeller fold protein YncE
MRATRRHGTSPPEGWARIAAIVVMVLAVTALPTPGAHATSEHGRSVTPGGLVGVVAVGAVLVDPAGEFAYVAANDLLGLRVTKVSLRTFEVVETLALRPFEGGVRGAAIDPDGRYAYLAVSDWASGSSVVKIDLASFRWVDAWEPTGGQREEISAMFIAPDGSHLYVVHHDRPRGRLAKLSLDTFEAVAVGDSPTGWGPSPDWLIDSAGRFAYVASPSDHVWKVDLDTLTTTDSLTLDLDIATGRDRLDDVAFIAPDGRYAYFQVRTDWVRDGFAKVDLEQFEQVGTIEGRGDWLGGVVASGDGRSALVGTFNDDIFGNEYWRLVKIDLTGGPPLAVIDLSEHRAGHTSVRPWYAAADPDGRSAHFVMSGGRMVTVDLTAAEVVAVTSLRSGAEGVTPFWDVPADAAHTRVIVEAFLYGITTGFPDGSYRRAVPVSRAQMASFLARALAAAGHELPPAAGRGFVDVGQGPHTEAIERLAGVGIVEGWTPTRFAPDETVSRGQTAALLVRAAGWALGRELRAQSGPHFSDTAGGVHAEAIDAAHELELLRGYPQAGEDTLGVFRPGEHTTRAQMAAVLVRSLDLLHHETSTGS